MPDTGPQCGACGYDATGLPGNTCPECGKQVLDRGARTSVAQSLAEFVDGGIEGNAVLARWPRETADPTLLRAGVELADTFEPFVSRRFGDHCQNARKLRAALTRWAVFLKSDGQLAYAPPSRRTSRYEAFVIGQIVLLLVLIATPFVRGNWFPLVVSALIASTVVPMMVRWLTGNRRWPGPAPAAERGLDSDCYPFASRADYEAARDKLLGAAS